MVAVERVEHAEGLIILPDRYKRGVKTVLATVVHRALDVSAVAVGDQVMLSAGINTHLVFGEGMQERKLYFCRPGELMGIVVGGEDADVEEIGEARGGRFPAIGHVAGLLHETAADEGDVKAPRR
jgi:hypothetical protein